jgi:hypothetical protein
MNIRLRKSLLVSLILAFCAWPSNVVAGPISVYVGYADDLRPNAYFPSPWQGSPNTIFQGRGTFDGGAIMIQNTTGAAITINSLQVSGFNDGHTYNNGNVGWPTNAVLQPGQYMIFTGYGENFDTSDNLTHFSYPDTPGNSGSGFNPSNPATNVPQILFTINGSQFTFQDTGLVLTTGGWDFATWGYSSTYNSSTFPHNESLQWRPIGGTGGVFNPAGDPPPVPEPGSLAVTFVCLMGLVVYGRGRIATRRVQCES